MISNVSVIIPARNEEENIGKMVRMILAIYSQSVIEIIVINDGSIDKTANIVSSIASRDKRVKLVHQKPHHGVGLALRKGLEHVSSRSSYILSIDADFIRNIPDLEDFFVNMKDYDGLIGSRYLEKNSLVHYPFLKKVCNRTFHLIVRLIFGIKQTDLTNNFKLYKKEVFQRLPLSSPDYAINAETGLYPVLLGYRIGELPVLWFTRSRNMGTSKFRLLQVAPGYLKVLINALKIKQREKNSSGQE